MQGAINELDGEKLSSVASDSDWTVHGSYPSACTGVNFVQELGDTLSCAQPSDVTGNAGTASAIQGWQNLVNDCNGSDSTTSSTGTIANASNVLTIVSASTWSSGMGILVEGAGVAGDGDDLVCDKVSITGTTFTLLNHDDTACNASTAACASGGCVVRHDNNYAFEQCIANNKNIYCGSEGYGYFQVSAPIIVNQPGIIIKGKSPTSTQIWNRGLTNNVFEIEAAQVTIEDMEIAQVETPATGGSAIVIGLSGTTRTQARIKNIILYQNYIGISEIATSNAILDTIVGNDFVYAGMLVDNLNPQGDNHHKNITFTMNDMDTSAIGIYIKKGDITEWDTVESKGFGGGNLKIDGSTGFVAGQTFTNCSFEVLQVDHEINVDITKSSSYYVGGIMFHGGDIGGDISKTNLTNIHVGNGVMDVMLSGVGLWHNTGNIIDFDGQGLEMLGCTLYDSYSDCVNIGPNARNVNLIGNNFDTCAANEINIDVAANNVNLFNTYADATPLIATLKNIEDCEDAWNEYVDSDVTSTADTFYWKGSYSAKMVVADNAAGGDILTTEAISSTNLSSYTQVRAMVYSTAALNASDLQLLLDNSINCGSPLETLNIPAVSANTWTLITINLAVPASDTAIISVGVKMVVDKGAFTFYIDDVNAQTTSSLLIANRAKIDGKFGIDVTGDMKIQSLTDSINGVAFYDADGGTPILKIDTINERIGINTTTPTSGLTVKRQLFMPAVDDISYDPGDGSGPGLRMGYSYSSDFGYIVAHNTGVGGKNLAVQPGGGKVGIGTTNPFTTLSNTTSDIADDYIGTSIYGITWSTSTSDKYEMAIQNTHDYGNGLLIKAGNDKNTARRLLNVANGDNTSRLIVKGDGLVGIGTTTPGNKLEVKDGHIVQIQTTIPTCSCSGGGTCATATGDTDESGTMTCAGGGASTTVTLIFNMSYARSPICMVQTVPTLASQYQSGLSTTQPIFTITSTTNPVVRYICR